MGIEVGRKRWVAALFVACVACEDSSCESVAGQLRECCARGPAELQANCESQAKALEEDGNADACNTALDKGTFARCAK